MTKTNGTKRAPRNSRPLSFGAAIDLLEAIRADEDEEYERTLEALRARQAARRMAIYDRCDPETQKRLVAYDRTEAGHGLIVPLMATDPNGEAE